MALNFPASPSTGDVHNASNNLSYFFDGVKWITQGSYNTGTINTIKLDSLTSSFNGSLTTFNLTSNSVSVKPANAQSVMISLGGVIQEPTTAYTKNSETGTISFASAPASSTAFFGIVYSRLPQSTTTVSDGAITNAKVNATAAIDKSKLNISDATTSASGYMSASDKTKLDGIEASATADQTNAEIRAAVEAATDSNVFTDADHTKLNSIEASATADQTASEIVALVADQTIAPSEIDMEDNEQIKLGTGDDLTLLHNGTDSKITNITGNLLIEPKASETGIKVIPDGSVELYHDNVKKVETSSTGLDITGAVKASTGILFGSDTADDNKLSDYEQGTFTPTLEGSSSNPTVNYHTQSGHYTKIGNVVHIQLLVITNSYSGGSGEWQCGGLPFTASSSAPNSFNFNWQQNNTIDWGSGTSSLGIFMTGNTTKIKARKFASNTDSALQLSAFSSSQLTVFGVHGSYIAA